MSSGSLTGNSIRNIRQEIVDKRRARIAAEGYGLGVEIPAQRTAPLVSFTRSPLVICEIKRKSPSRGDIAPGLNPVDQARLYVESGVQSVSVLTEEDYFGGSLADLIAVKTAFPQLAVLRKDFLVDETDVEVAWRAGADAVLLIASMLDADLLGSMLRRAESLGMAALVEVHSAEEIDKIRPWYPALVGINSRNLEDFRIDRLMPLGLRPLINWEAQVVFESGIFTFEDARYARIHQFQGILVGEAVVRKPQVIPDLIAGVGGSEEGASKSLGQWPRAPRPWYFWRRISDLLTQRAHAGNQKPLVKICGITRAEDGIEAVRLGADLIGFVFAPSPRRAGADVVRALAHLKVLRVAVVVGEVPAEVAELLHEGLIDAVQFSGDESPADCFAAVWPYYKALRIGSAEQLTQLEDWRGPRVLLDAWSAHAYGGTGKRLDPELIVAAASKVAIWMAGGISPDNIAAIVREQKPELVDLASSLESAPGIKDHQKLARFFAELNQAAN